MRNRISKILQEEGMTASKLADEIGVQASSISHIMSGRNNPSIDFVQKLLERFRAINSEWLLLGRGEMYKQSQGNISSNLPSSKPVENNLFSQVNNKEDKYSSIEPLKTADNEPENVEETAKSLEKDEFIKEHRETLKDSNSSSKEPKTVEKVIVLFTDGTFEYYNQA
ncbi:MAG TPA: helix-turn-helix transcriptional regulator [Bacteroidales bacterium]|nr:helix-turn-helix transcriptional regulator [Bacteroidales bacterium]